jgi:hypothetical protein
VARLIRRTDALRKINQLEEKARADGDQVCADWIVKCFNAVMSCRVEDRIFCSACGKKIQAAKAPEDGGA